MIMVESAALEFGHINLQMKLTGKPNVGNPHVGFDEAGAGNGLSSTAPAFDPTDEAGAGNGLSGTAPAFDPTCSGRQDLS